MKFYYNGQLLRTSKNHHYTHAVIARTDEGIFCHGCSSSEQGAEKLMNGLYQFRRYRTAVAVLNGTYRQKDRWSYSINKMRDEYTKMYGSVEKAVEHHKAIISVFEIVELSEEA